MACSGIHMLYSSFSSKPRAVVLFLNECLSKAIGQMSASKLMFKAGPAEVWKSVGFTRSAWGPLPVKDKVHSWWVFMVSGWLLGL